MACSDWLDNVQWHIQEVMRRGWQPPATPNEVKLLRAYKLRLVFNVVVVFIIYLTLTRLFFASTLKTRVRIDESHVTLNLNY